jgi:hypothetical protein
MALPWRDEAAVARIRARFTLWPRRNVFPGEDVFPGLDALSVIAELERQPNPRGRPPIEYKQELVTGFLQHWAELRKEARENGDKRWTKPEAVRSFVLADNEPHPERWFEYDLETDDGLEAAGKRCWALIREDVNRRLGPSK